VQYFGLQGQFGSELLSSGNDWKLFRFRFSVSHNPSIWFWKKKLNDQKKIKNILFVHKNKIENKKKKKDVIYQWN
jgi:hypothetical protein